MKKKVKKQIEKINYDSYQHRPPLEHQKKAIECLKANDKFILADDMGLGKTTSTVIASIERKSKKTLIICPSIPKNKLEERNRKLYRQNHFNNRRKEMGRLRLCNFKL